MDRIILFGAGASNGTDGILPEPPPLGNTLYQELARCYQQSWGSLPQDIRSIFQQDQGFEQGMQVLWDQNAQNISNLMCDMAIYLAQFRPHQSGIDLYSRLFSELNAKKISNTILYSTLNYECILEIAASAKGLAIHYGLDGNLDTELSINTIQVWKLHGSCNFIDDSIRGNGSIRLATGTWDGLLEPVSPNEAIQYCLTSIGLYPAMALYMKAKPVQIGKSIIQRLQENWSQVVQNTKRILIIGVKPYTEDLHIWKPLAKSQAEIAYVGSKASFTEWKSTYRPNQKAQYLGDRWNKCFNKTVSFISE